jgi:hypothetical protein
MFRDLHHGAKVYETMNTLDSLIRDGIPQSVLSAAVSKPPPPDPNRHLYEVWIGIRTDGMPDDYSGLLNPVAVVTGDGTQEILGMVRRL